MGDFRMNLLQQYGILVYLCFSGLLVTCYFLVGFYTGKKKKKKVKPKSHLTLMSSLGTSRNVCYVILMGHSNLLYQNNET